MILGGVFHPYILHFVLFNSQPKTCKKSSNILLNLLAISVDALPNNTMSSTKREWFIVFTPLAILSLVMFLSFLCFSKALLKISAIIIYRKGERGHPCLRPLVLWKNSLGLPFMRGAIQGVEMQAWMTSVISLENSSFLRTAIRYGRLTLSNAFAISNLIMIPFSFLCILECTTSCTIITLSMICLLGTNPP